jgi:hypothetical protein
MRTPIALSTSIRIVAIFVADIGPALRFRFNTDNYIYKAQASPQCYRAYKKGYRREAEKLVQHVLSDDADPNFLIYPIVFLYQRHLELTLKRILYRTPQLLGRAPTNAESDRLGDASSRWALNPAKVI